MTASSTPPSLAVPPLGNGDRLTRSEFARRYQAMPCGVKAERVEGVVYRGFPLRFAAHAEPHAQLMVWLGNAPVATPGVRQAGRCIPLEPDVGDSPQSGISGLLARPAVLRGDMTQVMAVLRLGFTSPSHEAFSQSIRP